MTNNRLIGQQIKHYRIDAQLGKGGMGEVYRATDLNLARPVALKIMHRQLAEQQQFKQRFLQEAQVVARLSHPSIVVVHDFDRHQEMLYLVMELVAGVSLGVYMKELAERNQIVHLAETVHIIAQVADALDYAHQEGIVHRDVKPDNILVKRLSRPERPSEPPLRALVTDFGLVKLLEGGVETTTGTFMGTLPYMSPEQALTRPIDGRSDIYSLGVVLYQLVTGHLPFDIQTPTDAVMKHLHETPPEPRQFQPGIPNDLEAVIVKALQKEPDHRYQTGDDMAVALRRTAGQLTEPVVTSFFTAAGRDAASLVTRLATSPPPAPPPRQTDIELNPSNLVVIRQGATTRSYRIDRSPCVIGRTEENDIVLPDAKVSRHHARLLQTGAGWQVEDLSSTNGTFIGEQRLTAGLPVRFNPGDTIRIGDYWLQLEPDGASPVHSMRRSDGTVVAPEEIRASPGRGNIAVHLVTPEVTAVPGSMAVFHLILLNQGTLVDHLTLSAANVPLDWVVSPPPVHLMPGEQQETAVRLQLPKSPQARAGIHQVTVQVTGVATSNEQVSVEGRLKITPVYAFQPELHPQKLRSAGSGEFKLLVQNRGNAASTYVFTAVDLEAACQFSFDPPKLSVPADSEGSVSLSVKPKPGQSAPAHFPFTVTVQGDDPAASKQQCQGSWELVLPTPTESHDLTRTQPVTPLPLVEPAAVPPAKPAFLPEAVQPPAVQPRPQRLGGCLVFLASLIVTAVCALAAALVSGSGSFLGIGPTEAAVIVGLAGVITSIVIARKVWQNK